MTSTWSLTDAIGENVVGTSGNDTFKAVLGAEGQADIYPRFGPTSQWDTAAAQAVLEVAGGLVADLQGTPLRYGLDRPVLNPEFVAVGDAALGMLPMVCPETMRDHLV